MKPPPPGEIREEPDAALAALGRRMEERFGFHIPAEKMDTLARAILKISGEMGISPDERFRMLLDASPESDALDRLAMRLTVGETFFFRERNFLRAFVERILPDVASRKKTGIRLWSAGCSTGEEPYTLSMLVRDAFPIFSPENVSVIGSDINSLALEKAREAVYSRWSFRGMDETTIHRYFDQCGKDRYSVKDPYRKNVSFARLNLAEDPWPLWSNVPGPDVIFCRNVLIYLSQTAREDILARFHRILPCGGWLVVASCETSASLSARFSSVTFGDATIYRKDPPPPSPFVAGPGRSPSTAEADSYARIPGMDDGDNGDFVRTEEESPSPERTDSGEAPEMKGPSGISSTPDDIETARRLADAGMFEAALHHIRAVHEKDRTDPAPLYLMSLLFQELGKDREALSALRGALFLDPDFILAHFTMGSLALRMGKAGEAHRHFRNVEELLVRIPENSILPESEGVTAGELLSSVRSLRRNASPDSGVT